MVIRKIQISGFEDIDRFESSFDSQLAILPSRNAEAIIKAIGVTLKSRFLMGYSLNPINDAEIRVKAELSGKIHDISVTGLPIEAGFDYEVMNEDGKPCKDFYDRIHQSPEEEYLSRFLFDRRNRYSDIFMRYKDVEKYYSKGQFAALTDGIGNTRLFRASLNEHMKGYMPQDLSLREDDPIVINNTGRFVLKGISGTASPTETGDRLFEYLCFLNVNLFWKKVEAVRDLNHVDWPLFLGHLPEMQGRNSDHPGYLKKALSLNRQVFLY